MDRIHLCNECYKSLKYKIDQIAAACSATKSNYKCYHTFVDPSLIINIT